MISMIKKWRLFFRRKKDDIWGRANQTGTKIGKRRAHCWCSTAVKLGTFERARMKRSSTMKTNKDVILGSRKLNTAYNLLKTAIHDLYEWMALLPWRYMERLMWLLDVRKVF